MIDLRFCINTYFNNIGTDGHPQEVMRKLGINYTDCNPIPVADCWIFYDCSCVPENLPLYLIDVSEKNES